MATQTIEQKAIQLAAFKDQADVIKEQIAALSDSIITDIQAAGDKKSVDTCVGRLTIAVTVEKFFTAPAVIKAQTTLEQWQAKVKAAKLVAEKMGQLTYGETTTMLRFSRKK